MIQEFLDESVDVVCYFGKKIKPLRFRRGKEIYKIKSVNGYWNKHVGNNMFHYFAVSTAQDVYFELELNSHNLKWKLKKIVDEI